MNASFKTLADALQAGYREVNRWHDRDISGGRGPSAAGGTHFGYEFRNADGEETVTVFLSEEENQQGKKGAVLPMYPPKK